MPVQLKDYSIEVKAALNNVTKTWLKETGLEVASQAQRGCTLDGPEGQKLRGSYKSIVQGPEAQVGSPLESVYWEEYGTGSHAAHGGGRPGWWVYIEGEGNGTGGKTYGSQAEAEEAAEFIRKVHKKTAHATNGRDPNYTLEKAFKNTSPKAQRRLEQMLKGGMG